ncbi:ATP synthase F0 subunit C [Candidatus Peregrinibacteria bacterium HGW-Peregrinibacteria-1]|jgi:F-type H+-transporting ATPase subunit c|nr:MAG: ATP synthase F0 subunit C [Candidatus Peregrinibacteria bacterium HGW-Peregrinibacteria-1]
MEIESAKFLAAGIALGLGGLGSAIGEGLVAGRAMDGMARNPKMADKLFTNMIVAMALVESSVIYTLVIALILIFS